MTLIKQIFADRFPFISVVSILIFSSFPAYGFYEYEGEENSVELRGFVRFFGIASENPDNSSYYENSSDFNGGGTGRLLLDARFGEHLAFEFNGYQYINSKTGAATSLVSEDIVPGDVERSSILEWKQRDKTKSTATLAADRLNLKVMSEYVDVTLGRQPVNLATVFYFTPNDFFAPFAAQNFFRIYKSGVDAARAEVQLGELSQLSIIGVLGYKPDASSSNGWNKNPALDRSSFLARIVANNFDFEWALLGGTVTNKNIIGASLQGELSDWLGLRAEGHYAAPEDNSINDYLEFTIGLEHSFPGDINLRGELFHHGTGANSTNGYGDGTVSSQSTLPYLARWYTAIGVGYQATPLLTLDGVAITNLVDSSNLLSFYAVYSLSDEAELSFGINLPVGKQTKNSSTTIRSEFGLYPYTANIEVRIYF